MEPGAPTRQTDHDPTRGRKDHDRNYKTVVQAHTCHLDEKSRLDDEGTYMQESGDARLPEVWELAFGVRLRQAS